MSIQQQRESVAEATIHQLRQLRAPDSLLKAATECTWVTDDENGVRRQFDLVTGRWSWKINGVWRYEQPQQAAAVPFTEQEQQILLIMREVHLGAPHWDSRMMTKDQIMQVLQLKSVEMGSRGGAGRHGIQGWRRARTRTSGRNDAIDTRAGRQGSH